MLSIRVTAVWRHVWKNWNDPNDQSSQAGGIVREKDCVDQWEVGQAGGAGGRKAGETNWFQFSFHSFQKSMDDFWQGSGPFENPISSPV